MRHVFFYYCSFNLLKFGKSKLFFGCNPLFFCILSSSPRVQLKFHPFFETGKQTKVFKSFPDIFPFSYFFNQRILNWPDPFKKVEDKTENRYFMDTDTERIEFRNNYTSGSSDWKSREFYNGMRRRVPISNLQYRIL